MGKNPAVLFYTSDFLSGTILFTDEQIGQYTKLLCQQHQMYPEHFPLNHMISVCGSIDSPVIKKFKKDDNGFYFNERMEEECEKRISFCKSRSNNRSGRKSKKSLDKSYGNCKIIHMENENDNENINDIEDSNTPKKPPEKTIPEKNIIPPTLEMVSRYCKERGNGIDPQTFIDHYTARDWKPKGYTKRMSDWQATIRTWEKNSSKSSQQKTTGRQIHEYERDAASKYDGL